MPQPYFLMSLLYLSLVALSWLASILTALEIIPLFGSLKWLRVHLVTLGALSELTFGLVPTLVASMRRRPRPKMPCSLFPFLFLEKAMLDRPGTVDALLDMRIAKVLY